MKKSFILLCGFLVLIFASCGSKPKVADEPVENPEQPAEQTIEETVTNATGAIEESAEELAKRAKENNAKALEKTENARQKAIDAGVDKLTPEQFAVVDALYQGLKATAETGKDVSRELEEVEKRFSALTQYAKATDAKKEIEDNNFIDFDKNAYEKGSADLAETEKLLKDPLTTTDALFEKADSASKSFQTVLYKAYKKQAKDARTDSFKAKKDADSVKAAVAAKADYNAAVEEFRAGDTNYSMQNTKSALGHYQKSKTMFENVYADVSVRRDAAQKAIDEAKAKVQASQNYALTADEKLPLESENVEGIEKEDAVLLEKTEFADPTKQEAEVPETIDDESNDTSATPSDDSVISSDDTSVISSEVEKSEAEKSSVVEEEPKVEAVTPGDAK